MQDNVIPIETQVVDCWNRTGVWGSKDCPELGRVLVCTNCETYSSAGRHLLDREPSEEYLREATETLARRKVKANQGTISVFAFRIGTEWLALPTRLLVEVLEPRPIHSLPHRAGQVLQGLVNVRGELHLCISLAAVLGIVEGRDGGSDAERTPAHLLHLCMEGEGLVISADAVSDIHRYQPEELGELPATLSKSSAPHTRGLLKWRGTHISVLDEKALFELITRSLK